MGLHAKMTALADAIREKSGISEPLGLDAMCQTVQGLHTFVPPVSGTADPDEVYRTTRPADWLPMPTPNDNETYCLCFIPESENGVFTAELHFTGNCSVEFGNIVNGVFTAKESITPTTQVRFSHTIQADAYGDITADGYKQYLVRIGGAVTRMYMNLNSHEVYKQGVPYLVDMAIGQKTELRCGDQTKTLACRYLKYVRFVGNGQLFDSYGQNFRCCKSLLSISSKQKATGHYASYMYEKCSSLLALSPNVFVSNVGYASAFEGANMVSVKGLQIQPTKINNMFRDCMNFNRIDGNQINTCNCNDFSGFAYNSSVSEIEHLNITSMTNPGDAFTYCGLIRVTFAGETTPGGWTINLTAGKMPHNALVEMLNSLPAATKAATITITGNPGADQLTDAEIAVATAKNWTVVI